MVGRVIRKISSMCYEYPSVPEDQVPQGPFGRLKVALVADHFTTECLAMECRIRSMTPANYQDVINCWRPDLVFVESTFHGAQGSWRYELAKQPRWLRLTQPQAIRNLAHHARSRGIPTVFWNKDDGAYFDAFIHVAELFDYVFTTDGECVEKYREKLPRGVPVHVLMMPYQPRFHHFENFRFVRNEACFTGSYYRQILCERKAFLDMIFASTSEAGMAVNIYDRNCKRFSRHFAFRFPSMPHLRLHPCVPHHGTAQVYKDHLISINVNSVTGSETMVSRRLLEILACGGLAVTNPSPAVERHFGQYCHVVATQEEAVELFSRLKYGPRSDDLERAAAGASFVRKMHTWEHRLQELCAVVNI